MRWWLLRSPATRLLRKWVTCVQNVCVCVLRMCLQSCVQQQQQQQQLAFYAPTAVHHSSSSGSVRFFNISRPWLSYRPCLQAVQQSADIGVKRLLLAGCWKAGCQHAPCMLNT
jgi:hypothetical protein